jgi:hypothetical protein
MGAFLEELKKPPTLIGVIVALIGIIAGGLISFYFYNKSEKTGRIAIVVEQVQVFDKTNIGQLPLRVLDVKGNVITDNVFAANVTIWNSGNAEIKKTDVRKPYSLKIGVDLEPLDLSVTSYTHDNVDKFSIDRDGKITWEHFDPDEGFKIRVVYVHSLQQAILLDGSASGITAALNLSPMFTRRTDFDATDIIVVLLAVAAELAVFLGIREIAVRIFGVIREEDDFRTSMFGIFTGQALFGLGILAFLIYANSSVPPL